MNLPSPAPRTVDPDILQVLEAHGHALAAHGRALVTIQEALAAQGEALRAQGEALRALDAKVDRIETTVLENGKMLSAIMRHLRLEISP